MNTHSDLPVVVIGAGPIGLAAAANLHNRGVDFLVLESGTQAGASVREWHHVRLFSPWSQLIDQEAAKILAGIGWSKPDPRRYPTGGAWAAEYLQPLADILDEKVRYSVTVTGVAKRGRDLIVDSGRDQEAFTVHAEGPHGEERILARAVIDASGTWSGTNPLGGDGLPAVGERAAEGRITYRVPDTKDPEVRDRFAGKHVAIAGTGVSAKTALLNLADLDGTRMSWLVRRPSTGNAFGGGENDELAERGALGSRAKKLVESGSVRTCTGFRTASVHTQDDERLTLTSFDGATVSGVDEVIVLTGFRPDLTILTEVRTDLDPVLEAPRALAPLIDPNVHSCGTVYPHGAQELVQPDSGFYLAGMKSYGRATSFLAMTGFEQVRSIVAAIAGDHEAASRVELTLPDTGVCGGSGVFDDEQPSPNGGCCGSSETSRVELLEVGKSSGT